MSITIISLFSINFEWQYHLKKTYNARARGIYARSAMLLITRPGPPRPRPRPQPPRPRPRPRPQPPRPRPRPSIQNSVLKYKFGQGPRPSTTTLSISTPCYMLRRCTTDRKRSSHRSHFTLRCNVLTLALRPQPNSPPQKISSQMPDSPSASYTHTLHGIIT
jgi:hypothetical protein